jgi:hypothetical protein
MPEERDQLMELLRSLGYDAYEFEPGETLPQFIARIHRDHPDYLP